MINMPIFTGLFLCLQLRYHFKITMLRKAVFLTHYNSGKGKTSIDPILYSVESFVSRSIAAEEGRQLFKATRSLAY